MTPLGVWLTITIVITAGLLLGVALSWIDPPKWATPGRLAVILLFVAIADAGVTYLQQAAPVVASAGGQDSSAAASAAGLVPTGKIDPAQAARAIVAITGENSGRSHLVESSLDGTVNSALGPGPLGGPFAVAGDSDLVVAAIPDGNAHASGLEITSLSGAPVRLLTWPKADTTDTDPAVTADGEVYFERTAYVWTGPNGTPAGTKIMRVPISRKSGTIRVPESVPLSFGSLSVNAAGTLLAGVCAPPGSGGASEACVLALPSGRLRYVTHFNQSTPVTDVALSPDGKYLAYGDGAANAYGTTQVYVEDLATGSVVMVSRLPGNSGQPSWVTGSAVPCLLFSNSQTSGDVVYLSCLSAVPGTARIAAGDYPEWLGTRLPAARPTPVTVNWRGLWGKSRPAILLAGMFVLGLLVGLLGGWFPRPAWATRPRLAGVIVALGLLQVGGMLVVPDMFGQPSGGLTTVTQLDPGQAGGLLVAVVSTGGTGQLFGVRLNGTNVQPVQFYPGGSSFIPVDDVASKFVYDYGTGIGADIRLVGATGNEIRELSDPPAGKTDSAPAFAARARQVFFVRSTVIPDGPSAWTTTSPVVMRVSLSGGPARRVPLTQAPAAGPISVDAAGTELAAACPDRQYLQACVYDLPGGQLRDTITTPVGAANLALSPDGRYLAYSNGIDTVLYVHDFQTGQTLTVSSLPGWNEQPSWLQGGASPCLLYVNEQTAADTIYLACLTPRLAWAPVTQGVNPAWLGP